MSGEAFARNAWGDGADAERDPLNAELDRLRSIVAALADDGPFLDELALCVICGGTGMEPWHRPECSWFRAVEATRGTEGK